MQSTTRSKSHFVSHSPHPLAVSQASYSSSGGDSGGTIYRSLTTGRRIVGVHARSGGQYVSVSSAVRVLNLTLV